MTDKEIRSVRLPADLNELMKERDDVNWSAVIRQFLQEYVASGQGTEAALAVRKEQVESELADARAEVERLERERDRLEAALGEKRDERRDVFESFASLQGIDDPGPSNPAVQRHAEKIGMAPETFLAKYREWNR